MKFTRDMGAHVSSSLRLPLAAAPSAPSLTYMACGEVAEPVLSATTPYTCSGPHTVRPAHLSSGPLVQLVSPSRASQRFLPILWRTATPGPYQTGLAGSNVPLSALHQSHLTHLLPPFGANWVLPRLAC